jgi:hypothetical protein
MVADRIVQLGKEPRLLKSEILKLKEIFDPMRLRRLDADRGHDQLVIDQLRSVLVRSRLLAGESWIRTSSSAPNSHALRRLR